MVLQNSTDPAFTFPTGTRSSSRKRSRRDREEEKYLAMCLVKLARGSSEILKPPASFALNYLEQENVVLTKAIIDQENSALTTILDLKKGQEPNVHVCDVCRDSFSCHQALGGHKSKHSPKPRTGVLSVKKSVKVSSTGEKVHQCGTCDKIFDSGQALGGHMRVHYEGVIGVGVSAKKRSVETVKSPSNAGGASVCNGRVVMDFDLNVDLTEDTLYCDQVQSAMVLV